jgi:hypothetical protein
MRYRVGQLGEIGEYQMLSKIRIESILLLKPLLV